MIPKARDLNVSPRQDPPRASLVGNTRDPGKGFGVAQLSTIQGFVDSPGYGPAPVSNMRGDLVSLGPLRRDLLPTYQRWLNDFGMLKLVDRRFRPHSAEWVTTWYERHAGGLQDAMVFTITTNQGNRPIGNVALQDIDYRSRTAEFGIYIGEPDCRGQGFGTEATRLLLEFAFNILGLHNVMLRVYEYNPGAVRAYEKAGFHEFGRRRKAQFMDGRFWDVIFMECVANDFHLEA
jgi:RimJ/RimL family protein N-acetyltransferase